MEDWTRVLLYGTYDGFTRSTDDLHRIVVVLDGGERVEIPKGSVISADQIVNKHKIKLKDVIARIKVFDGGTQKVWLNEILSELGSDYGILKYKAGYDQGKLEGEWVGQQLKDADKIRQELNKPTVPQFVADWYKEHKDDFETKLFRAVDLIPSDYEEGELSEFEEWLVDEHTAPFQTLVNMHQFGYEVEQEKRYLVKMKGISSNMCYLNRVGNKWIIAGIDEHTGMNIYTKHTRKELEEAGFDWVFDCTGIEIDEVE